MKKKKKLKYLFVKKSLYMSDEHLTLDKKVRKLKKEK